MLEPTHPMRWHTSLRFLAVWVAGNDLITTVITTEAVFSGSAAWIRLASIMSHCC